MKRVKKIFDNPDLIAISFQFSFLIACTLTVILILFAACNQIPGEVKTTETGLTYKSFTIEGMPCVYVKEDASHDWATGGPSCDWSKWKGDK